MRQLLALALLLSSFASALSAPPPDGSEDAMLLAPYSAEISAASGANGRCCDLADGTAVDARPAANGWQIHFRNDRFPNHPIGWIDVPPSAVLHKWTNPTGIPIVWWRLGQIQCFAPPSES